MVPPLGGICGAGRGDAAGRADDGPAGRSQHGPFGFELRPAEAAAADRLLLGLRQRSAATQPPHGLFRTEPSTGAFDRRRRRHPPAGARGIPPGRRRQVHGTETLRPGLRTGADGDGRRPAIPAAFPRAFSFGNTATLFLRAGSVKTATVGKCPISLYDENLDGSYRKGVAGLCVGDPGKIGIFAPVADLLPTPRRSTASSRSPRTAQA